MAINIFQYLRERKLQKQNEKKILEFTKSIYHLYENNRNKPSIFLEYDPTKPIRYTPSIEPMFTVEYDDIRNELRSMDSGTIERALNELFDHLRKYQEDIRK